MNETEIQVSVQLENENNPLPVNWNPERFLSNGKAVNKSLGETYPSVHDGLAFGA